MRKTSTSTWTTVSSRSSKQPRSLTVDIDAPSQGFSVGRNEKVVARPSPRYARFTVIAGGGQQGAPESRRLGGAPV